MLGQRPLGRGLMALGLAATTACGGPDDAPTPEVQIVARLRSLEGEAMAVAREVRQTAAHVPHDPTAVGGHSNSSPTSPEIRLLIATWDGYVGAWWDNEAFQSYVEALRELYARGPSGEAAYTVPDAQLAKFLRQQFFRLPRPVVDLRDPPQVGDWVRPQPAHR